MEKVEQMRELVSQWRSSGLTRQEFCDFHEGISLSKLRYWITQFNKQESESGFAELTMGAISYDTIKINYPNGVWVEVRGYDLTNLHHLIKIY